MRVSRVPCAIVLQVEKSWLWKYYTYRVRVFNPWRLKIETYEVSDPYARALASDGVRTQVLTTRSCSFHLFMFLLASPLCLTSPFF